MILGLMLAAITAKATVTATNAGSHQSVTGGFVLQRLGTDLTNGWARIGLKYTVSFVPALPGSSYYDHADYGISATLNGTSIYSSGALGASGRIPLEEPVGTTITITEGASAYFQNPLDYTYSLYDAHSASANYTFTDPNISEKGDLGLIKSAKDVAAYLLDPVNYRTGEFYVNATDLQLPGVFPIQLRRTYSSRSAAPNEFGYGWLFGYSTYLVMSDDLTTIQAADSDGSVVMLRRQGVTNTWLATSADNPEMSNTAGAIGNLLNSSIVQTTAGSNVTYQWKMPDGSLRNYVVRQFPITSLGVLYPRERPYLDKWIDNRGNSLSFTFDSNSTHNAYGRVTQIQSSNGTSLSLAYDTGGRITTATAGDGRTVQYTYSPLGGDLINVQLPDGANFGYVYANGSEGHLIVKETKPDGRALKNEYDGADRVFRQSVAIDPTYPNNFYENGYFDYSVPGRTSVKAGGGTPTVYYYADGLTTQIVDPLGRTTTNTWYTTTDPLTGAYQRSLQSVTDPRGLVTTYRYDALGNRIQSQMTGDLRGDGVTTRTATATATFDALSRITSNTDSSGITSTFDYTNSAYPYLPTVVTIKSGSTVLRTDKSDYFDKLDAVNPTTIFTKGLLLRRTTAFGSADQAVGEFDYNVLGLVTQQTSYTGTTDPNVLMTMAYNARGEATTVTDGDGRRTNFTYDGMSRPLTKTIKDEGGNSLGTWTMTYNGNGDLTSTTGFRTGPADLIQNTYDMLGRKTAIVVAQSAARTDGNGVQSAASTTTSCTYDIVGNIRTSHDAIGRLTDYSYDSAFQLLSRTVMQFATESWLYEPGGQVSQYTNQLGGITKTYYTTTGRPRRKENADGSVQEWRYLDDGRLNQEILSNGTIQTTTYDDVAHKVTRTLKNSEGTTLATELDEFDLRGNLIRRTDREGFVTTSTYDDLNRIKTSTGPAAGTGYAQQTVTSTYGASAKTAAVTNGLNEITTTLADALGRPTQRTVKSAAGTTLRLTTYTYSADHQSTTVTEGSGAGAVSSTVYTDTTGRLVLMIDGNGKFTRTVYDANGNVLSTTDKLNLTTSYLYYGFLYLLYQETKPDGAVTSHWYNVAGQETLRRSTQATLSHEQTYDTAGRRLTERIYGLDGSVMRSYSYGYYAVGTPFAGLLQTVTGPRSTRTIAYDDFMRTQSLTDAGALAETNGTTSYTYDRRGSITAVNQSSTGNAAGPATQVSRTYSGYGQMLTEAVTIAGSGHSSVTQTWDAAGRRASLTEAGSTLPSPLFAYQYQADGAMIRVTANSQNYDFAYGDNGLLVSRTSPYRVRTVTSRDPAGQILQQSTTVGGSSVMGETMAWRNDGTIASYGLTQTGAGGANETRPYTYDARGQLLSEGFSLAAGQPNTLTYTFDDYPARLGIRLSAKVGPGAPASWQATANTFNKLGLVTADTFTENLRMVPASGVSLGADHVDLLIDGAFLMRATHPGWTDSVGAWSANMPVFSGSHTLTANAVHPSGHYTATATSAFTAPGSTGNAGAVTNTYDGEGNVAARTWATGRVQTLTWDSLGRLIKVVDRNAANTGADWTAAYDGLGRRLKVTQQAVVAGAPSGGATLTTSIYDPQVEFLEIGVAINGAKAWKVYGLDLNGAFGSFQGTGGLEATIVDVGGATKGIVNDFYGNVVGTVSGGGVTWLDMKCSSYGPLTGTATEVLSDITRVAEVSAWRTRRLDATGFIYLGARYYEPVSGRFLSADPAGYVKGMNLYNFCSGDPVNTFDPDGRLAKAFGDEALDLGNDLDNGIVNLGLVLQDAHDAAMITAMAPFDPTLLNSWQFNTDLFNNNSRETVAGGLLDKQILIGTGKAATFGVANAMEATVDLANGDYRGARNNFASAFVGLVGAKTAGVSAEAGEVSQAGTSAGSSAAETAGADVYSVAYRTRLAPESYPGLSRGAHFQEANGNLLSAMEGDASFANAMKDLGVNLERTPTGLAPRGSPAGWTWHHAPELGQMELVPRFQHAPGSAWQELLHPGGQGGYSIWGK